MRSPLRFSPRDLLADMRHSFRQLRQRPLFAATAVLTLAIGMGINAVAFSVVNGLLFKGYALGGLPGMGRVMVTPGDEESGNVSLPEYHRFRDALDTAADVAAEGRLSAAWKHDGTSDTAWVLYVSANYFLLVPPPLVAGRLAVERSHDAVSVVIGERFWRERLGSPSLAGLTLRLNDVDVAVSGVIAGSWTGPAGIYSPDVWLPLDELTLFNASPQVQRRDARWLFVMARLRDSASAAQLNSLVASTAATLAHDWPDTHTGRSAMFRLFGSPGTEMRGLATASALAMGVIGLVLLIACFNVANLLLARAVEREREIAMRAALGAGPGRLVRLVLVDGCVLASLSGAVAVVLAWWTQSLVGSFAIPIEQPQHIDLALDVRVVAFIALLVVIAGIVPGLWPAITASRVDLLRVLGAQAAGGDGVRRARARGWLVAAQVAGSTAFLVLAFLFVQSYAATAQLDPGFARDHVVLAEIDPGDSGYDAAQARQFAEAFHDRVRALPGVADVGLIDQAPFFIGFDRRLSVSRLDESCTECRTYPAYAVGPNYFRTMGIGFAAGRDFGASASNRSDAIVNAALADVLWPSGNAVGQAIRIGDRTATIIGVTANTHIRGLGAISPALYVPMRDDDYARGFTVIARTADAPTNLLRPMSEAGRAIDPNVSMASVKTMPQRMAIQMWPVRTLTWLFALCGGLALVLATIGLAGVVMYTVSRRTREFGVRLSIGATPTDLAREVLAGGGRLLVPGLAMGLLLAAAAARMAQALFVGVDVANPLAYLLATAVQSFVVVGACLLPALRAARVDPLAALRSE